MEIFVTMFYSYQVVQENNFLFFGQGVLKVDVTWQSLNFESCYEQIKERAQEQRRKEGLEAIDWNFWKLHILAFNQMPE